MSAEVCSLIAAAATATAVLRLCQMELGSSVVSLVALGAVALAGSWVEGRSRSPG
jgi:hypothetical protein